MIKTKSPSIKKPERSVVRVRPSIRRQNNNPSSSHVARKQRLNTFLRGLKSQIKNLTDYIANEPLSREETLFFMSQLHTLNIVRDKLEIKKSGVTDGELLLLSQHLGKKMQSAFSN